MTMQKFGLREMRTLKVFHLIFIMMWTMGVVLMTILYWRKPNDSMEFIYNQETSLLIDYILVIPGAILAVVTGIIYGLKTNWGFFKYRWLTIKWIVGIAIIVIGTFILHPLALDILTEAYNDVENNIDFITDCFGAKYKIVSFAALIQSLGLLVLIAISVFKPWNKKTNKKL